MQTKQEKLFTITKEICYRLNVIDAIVRRKKEGYEIGDDDRDLITNRKELVRLRKVQRQLEHEIEKERKRDYR